MNVASSAPKKVRSGLTSEPASVATTATIESIAAWVNGLGSGSFRSQAADRRGHPYSGTAIKRIVSGTSTARDST
jgi:hypothetical protein